MLKLLIFINPMANGLRLCNFKTALLVDWRAEVFSYPDRAMERGLAMGLTLGALTARSVPLHYLSLAGLGKNNAYLVFLCKLRGFSALWKSFFRA